MSKPKSLFSSIYNHVLDTFLGRKYYFVLMRYPNQRVRFTDATVRPVPLVETSSSIMFTEQEAYQYLQEFQSSDASEPIVSVEVHSFRSRAEIPEWSRYRDYKITSQGFRSRII